MNGTFLQNKLMFLLLALSATPLAMADQYEYRIASRGLKATTTAPTPVKESLTLSASSINFGHLNNEDLTSVARTITVTNPTDTDKAVTVSGAHPEVTVDNSCTLLPAKESCTLTFTYTPMTRLAEGTLGTYNITTDDGDSLSAEVLGGAEWSAHLLSFENQKPAVSGNLCSAQGGVAQESDVGASQAAHGTWVALMSSPANCALNAYIAYTIPVTATEGRAVVSRKAISGAWVGIAADSKRNFFDAFAQISLNSNWTKTTYTGFVGGSYAAVGVQRANTTGGGTAYIDAVYFAWR